MRKPTEIELYNSQSNEYLEKLRDGMIEAGGIQKSTLDKINYILKSRRDGEDIKECMGVCGGACGDKCVNL